MFKKFSERFPTAAKSLESLAGSGSGAGSAASPAPSASDDSAENDSAQQQSVSGGDGGGGDDSEESANHAGDGGATPPKSDERRLAHMRAALAEKINSESVSAAASVAATSMLGFMKKAQSVASVAAREGAAKAAALKNKALDAADMDALQRRLSYALDRSTGEVNLELLNFSYISDNLVAMGFPSMNLGTNRTLLKDNPIDLVSMYLNDAHGGHYMIWNLSGAMGALLCMIRRVSGTDNRCSSCGWYRGDLRLHVL